jgi:hypothetical protein
MNVSGSTPGQAAVSDSPVHFAVHFPVVFIYPTQYV